MYREELEDLIQRLRPEGSTPFFSIEDAPAGGYIRANREGLQVFARELLRASLSFDYSKDGSAVPLPAHVLPDGGLRLAHVEPFSGEALLLPEPQPEADFRRNLARGAVVLGALVAATSLLIGFYTMVRWFF